MTTSFVTVAPHRFAYGFYRQAWWNWLIGTAFFCGGLGAGFFLISLATGLRLGMIVGYLVVVVGKNGAHLLYLGRPERFWRAAMRPDRSWIARGIWASGLFALSGGLLLLPAILGSEWQVTGGLATAAKAIAIASGLFIMFYDGFVMNHSAAIPFWNTQLLPLLILMYATLGGTTLTLTLGALQGHGSREAGWLEKAEPYLLIANFMLLCVYLLRMSHWTPAARETVRMWVKGKYARVFLGLIVAVGLIATLMLSLVQLQWQARELSLVIAGCELTGDFSLLMLMLKSGLFSAQTAPAFAPRGNGA
ncbi:MAG: polysulfide reductase NrfD [Acidobacteriia bacterium]|nr:polysulfide reductase NrfD [Terriglobia bacterium]